MSANLFIRAVGFPDLAGKETGIAGQVHASPSPRRLTLSAEMDCGVAFNLGQA